MQLTYEGIRDRSAWEAAGIALPAYDVEKASALAKAAPRWAHFGIGNIFRVFLGSIAEKLLEEGKLDRGLTCLETYDEEVVRRIYDPHDNLVLSVILEPDGRRDVRVYGCLAEALFADLTEPAAAARLRQIFAAPSLQLVTFTVTEKAYALRDSAGAFLPAVAADLSAGPDDARTAVGVVTAGLLARFEAGGAPLALVSCDNCSGNGDRLREAVVTMARAWEENGFVPAAFAEYVSDTSRVAFPWTMIDKITPRPDAAIASWLEEKGVEGLAPIATKKHTYIAPFGNAERPQYLVIEDDFPNGRPPFEEAGVLLADRATVARAERMKVTACLNPIHTALCTYDCLLGYDLFADGMHDPELHELARRLGYDEGLPVVEDPGILSPKAFLDECMNERFPNPYLGDTSSRIATDISQMTAIRFGETIKSWVQKTGTAAHLTAMPLAIAGWFRYLLAVDDEGHPMELAPDPEIPALQEKLAGVRLGEPESAKGVLRPLLSDARLFASDLYEAGLGETIEEIFAELIAGPGAVRKTLRQRLG